MQPVTLKEQTESIRSFKSTIRKCETALAQMNEKRSNTVLLEKRLNALNIGLQMLEAVWHRKLLPYDQEKLAEVREVLAGMLPSIEKAYANQKEGSPQKTLLERRIKSLELAIQAIDDHASKNFKSHDTF